MPRQQAAFKQPVSNHEPRIHQQSTSQILALGQLTSWICLVLKLMALLLKQPRKRRPPLVDQGVVAAQLAQHGVATHAARHDMLGTLEDLGTARLGGGRIGFGTHVTRRFLLACRTQWCTGQFLNSLKLNTRTELNHLKPVGRDIDHSQISVDTIDDTPPC